MRKTLHGLMMVLSMALAAGAESVPADFTAAFAPVGELKQKLSANGLQVLGSHEIAGNSNYVSVVYTSPELKRAAELPKRGFAATLRVLVDLEGKRLVAANPEYYLRAFLQGDYVEGMAAPVAEKLKKALGEWTPTEDAMDAKKLAKYRFMFAMPRYDAFQTVAKGAQEILCEKIELRAKDSIVFKLDLKGDGSSVLYGVAMPPEVEKFNEKIGTMNKAYLLPYVVWIEGDEAKILPARYYLALSFPRLTMTEFGRIMSTPGKIKKAIAADFE